MAEWFYRKNGEKIGPVGTRELKALAQRGELGREDLIWREGQEWVKAKKIEGLFGSGPPPTPKLPSKQEAAIKLVEDKAEDISNKLWFLDLKFTKFYTPNLIGFVYVMFIVMLALAAVGVGLYALWNEPLLVAVFIFVFDVILFVIMAVCFRVFLESFLVVFRIADHLSYLRFLEKTPLE